uniref:Elongator complex protein 2 n=1 Tax=Lygus hesperus TaxID=30085 RepID=A0A0A9W8Z0_LYGHE
MASSSQDGSVRVWKISLNESADPTSETESPTHEFKMEKKSFSLGSKSFSVALETVLLGHEGWVYAAKWFPTAKGSNLQLLTFSCDHTIILWSPDEETGVWFEKARLGNVGGEALGFLGGAVGPQGLSVVAHSHQGSLNLWHFSTEEDRWCPKPICCGHFDEVTDLAWEPNGHFLLSVSADQTTRLHAQWSTSPAVNQQGAWYEMARPQIHGYGMNSIATLPDFRFVSAADEKIARAFGAPRNTLENLRILSGVEVSDELLETSSEPMGATVPALGLSNKAVFTEETEVNKTKKGQNEDDTSYFTRQLLKEPPTDDFLSQNSLWPETMKLYGHGYDVYSVAASHNGRFVATACKATVAEHARIILWETDSWEKVHDFDGSGHSLTVTQMCFSPDDSFLLSVSRDRNWTIHGTDKDAASYRLLASSDKKTGVHSRIIWTCCWSHDSAFFATASREGICAVWSSDHLRDAQTKDAVAVATKDWLAGPTKAFPESVTSLAFSPRLLSGDSVYLLAIGTESGTVHLASFSSSSTDSWIILSTIDNLHSATISRVSFRPEHPSRSAEFTDELMLATSSHDHSVKIFTLRPSLMAS